MAPSRPAYLVRAVRAARAQPGDASAKLMEKLAGRWERVRRGEQRPLYRAPEDWERRLHNALGAPWPCPLTAAFADAWAGVIETMSLHGLRVGRRNYGGDDDADSGLARALWCLVHHLGAREVVETGVAHGVSSRIMLEALRRSSGGRLSSVDLAPMTIPERGAEVAVAIPEELRDRWVFVQGASRRRLPGLLRELGPIDLFVHDSQHSTRNVHWELTRSWRMLRPGGFVVVDDVEHNWGFDSFLRGCKDRDPLWCRADDGQRLFAVARKDRHAGR